MKNRLKHLSQLQVRKHFTLGEEISHSVTHGIGLGLGIVALILLVIKGSRSRDGLYLVSMVIYASSLIILYTNSMFYHGMPEGGAKNLFEKLDHASVYLLIAGTYTPFCLLAVGGVKGIVVCSIQWALAAVGVVFKSIWIDKYVKIHVSIYLVMGWTIIFFGSAIFDSLASVGFTLVFLGGIGYSIGVLFYIFDWFKYHHFIWHLFVLAASILHFFAIYLYV